MSSPHFRPFSRRQYLRAGVASGLAVLGGCAARRGPADGTPTAASTSGLFAALAFDGSDLVVTLESDHEIRGLNLIAPDGTGFERARVAAGATTVRIPVLDIRRDLSGYRHYTPGTHELVAVDADDTEVGSTTIEMRPELTLIDVRQYQLGDRSSDLGSLVIAVENTGTAPTWVYDISYRDAPNFAANVELSDSPGVPLIRSIPEGSTFVISPTAIKEYIDVTPPLLFRSDQANCSGSGEFTVLIAAASGQVLEQRLYAEWTGDQRPAGLVDAYTCSDVAVTQELSASEREEENHRGGLL